MDELGAAYGDQVLDPPIPDRTAIQQAEGACVPVQAWRSPGAREVTDALDDHFDRLMALPVADGPLGTGRSSHDRPHPDPCGRPRNPGPRPALQRRTDDDTVISARPRAGTAPATARSLAPPLPGADEDTPTTGRRRRRTRARTTRRRPSSRPTATTRAGKDGKKHKDRHHKDGKSARSGKDGGHGVGKEAVRDERELAIVLPKAVRRALADAAVEHGTTPERLVTLVLSEWLDH